MDRTRLLVPLVAAAAALLVVLPSAAGAPSSAGEVAIFYYPWYSNPTHDGGWAHWHVERNGKRTLSTPYYPSRGLYSSSSPRVVSAHMREIRAAGVETVIVSWWGSGSAEDRRLDLVTETARRYGLRTAIHLEPYGGRTPRSTAQDIAQFRERGYTDFYVYDAERDPADAWAAALADHGDVRVFGHTRFAGRAKASGFDGVYTYDIVTWKGRMFGRMCAQARRLELLCAPSVGPGFDARLATTVDTVLPRLGGKTYDRMWAAAIAAGADLVTITSYNEWQEGTQIEPARLRVGAAPRESHWETYGVGAQRAYLQATRSWSARYRLFDRQ